MIYIGKKASKIRRSPKRSREQLSPECHVSAERHTHGRQDFHSSSKKSEDHDDDDDDDLADKPAKHLGKPEKSTHNAWDDDWNNVDEHLRACARAKHKQLDVAHGKRKEKCCLVDALRAFGFKVSYDRDGPFWVLEDGSDMLRLFGYIISPVSRICNAGPGRWLVCRDGHCIALRRKGEGNTWIFDGADRRRVAASDLNTLMRGAKIFQVPSILS